MSHAVVQRGVHPRLFGEELYVSADPRTPSKPSVGGRELAFVIGQLQEAAVHFQIPIARQQESLIGRFRQLADTWRADVGALSSLTQMAMHPAYQQIIGMGREAIPLLLRELEREPDHWFWALKAITGVDPVPLGVKGRIDEMATAWLQWGREQGFRW